MKTLKVKGTDVKIGVNKAGMIMFTCPHWDGSFLKGEDICVKCSTKVSDVLISVGFAELVEGS